MNKLNIKAANDISSKLTALINRKAVRSSELKNTVIPERLLSARHAEIEVLENNIQSLQTQYNTLNKGSILMKNSIQATSTHPTLIAIVIWAALVVACVLALASENKAYADSVSFLPYTKHSSGCVVSTCPKYGYNERNEILAWNNDKVMLMTMENSFYSRTYYIGTYGERNLGNSGKLRGYYTVGITHGYWKDQGFMLFDNNTHLGASIGLKYNVAKAFDLVMNSTLSGTVSVGFGYNY